MYLKTWADLLVGGHFQFEATWLINKELLFGDAGTFNFQTKQLKAYEHGLVWEPKQDLNVGLKHQANVNSGGFSLGKLLFMFHHKASQSQQLGAEFSYNHANKQT